MYPLPQEIETAFRESEFLVVESDLRTLDVQSLVDDVDTWARYQASKDASYLRNDSLEKHISARLMNQVVRYCKINDLPINSIRRCKPWALGLIIWQRELKKHRMDLLSSALHGIDVYFLLKSREGKQVLEIESHDWLIEYFNDFLSYVPKMSDREQEALLRASIEIADNRRAETNKVIDLWLKGDAKEIERLISRGVEYYPNLLFLLDKIIYQRNEKMTERILQYLDTGSTYFVVVGVGHFVGEKGIIELLRQRKCRVERVEYRTE